MKVNMLADLETYNPHGKGQRNELYSELKKLSETFDKDELKLAQSIYEKLCELDIRNMGVLSNIELAMKLTNWLYPRMLMEAYKVKINLREK